MSKSRYPGIERLSSGRYRVRVTWNDPKTGKRRDQKKVIAANSMAEASSLRELLRTRLLTGGTTPEHRLRLGEYASSWMRGKIPTLKPSTRDKYAGMLDQHILPALGDHYLDAISPQDVILWRDAQHAKASTVNSRLRVLRALLRDAQADLGLPRDPCARIRTLPEKPPVGNRLKPGDLQRVLAYLREDEPGWYPLFLTMALTGARFGEVSALRWDDIDEDAGVIWIRRSQWQGRVGTTKTGKVRDVPLPPPLKAGPETTPAATRQKPGPRALRGSGLSESRWDLSTKRLAPEGLWSGLYGRPASTTASPFTAFAAPGTTCSGKCHRARSRNR